MQEDRIKYGISETDEEIEALSKEQFKSVIWKKIDAYVVGSLNEMEKHTQSLKIW